jgi:branched-chain amino acid transport system ATP-binding protein
MSAPLLAVKKVTCCYGRIPVLHGVSLDIHLGEIVALIGANGAGKSTLMMSIFGRPRASEGRILFAGEDITDLPTHEIARLGIAQSPEGRRIFARMTVLENLQMGALIASDPDYFVKDLEHVFELFPLLKRRQHQRGGTLSGGEQQMLAIARALMGRPKLLLLDEPSLGLSPRMQGDVFATVQRIAASGVTVLIVEQNVRGALLISDRALVMEQGRLFMEGPAAEVRTDPRIRQAYLGGNIQQTAA